MNAGASTKLVDNTNTVRASRESFGILKALWPIPLSSTYIRTVIILFLKGSPK